MAYLGKSPSQGVRNRYYFTASGGETSISGALTGGTLTFTDGNYVDVNLNGVTLVAGTDYNTSTANTIAGLSALTASDVVEIVVYDVFSVFSGNVNSDFSVGGNLSVTGTTAFTGATTVTGLTTTGDINFGDNDKASFSSGKLQIYHDGTNAYIDETFANGTFLIRGNNISLQKYTGETMIQCVSDGKVELNFNNVPKLETTSSGVDVTGTAVTDGLTVAGNVSVDGGTIKLDGNYPTGTNNVALGDTALDDGSLSGGNNVAIGQASLTANTSGAENIAVGKSALEANTTGASNTAVGHRALDNNTTASNNTAMGFRALDANTTGTNNVAVGRLALSSATTANNNTAVGTDAGDAVTTGANNTFLGYGVAFQLTTASNNTGVGYLALSSSTTGQQNTAVGQNAADAITTGGINTVVGSNALGQTTTGNYNVAIGSDALTSNTTASSNTAMGYAALNANTTGSSIVAIGSYAGYTTTTTGDGTFVGAGAGQNATSADHNTYIGRYAGGDMTSGTKNTIIGRYAGNQGGLDIRTSSNNIVLSDGGGNPRFHCDSNGKFVFTDTGGSSVSQLDDSRVTVYMDGSNMSRAMTITTATNTEKIHIGFRNGNGIVGSIRTTNSATAFQTSSDYRLKENVTYDWNATTRLKQLKPARFNWISDNTNTLLDGFMAHEVSSIVPEAISGTKDEVDDDGNAVMQGIDQSKLVPLLVKTIQELEARIAALEGE